MRDDDVPTGAGLPEKTAFGSITADGITVTPPVEFGTMVTPTNCTML